LNDKSRRARKTAGFSLVELVVTMLVVGILAGISYPQYIQHVESGRVQEAVETISAISAAEGRYYAKYNSYCVAASFACGGFDTPATALADLHYFGTPAPVSGASPWAVSMQRLTATPIYGQYTITYNPSSAPQFSCVPGATNCQNLVPTYFAN
jgi:type IV pilus assembly protein PilE